MELLPQFSRSKRNLTKNEMRSELGFVFSGILQDNKKKRKRKLVTLEFNILSRLDDKPLVRVRTKKIFNGFRAFLDEFEK